MNGKIALTILVTILFTQILMLAIHFDDFQKLTNLRIVKEPITVRITPKPLPTGIDLNNIDFGTPSATASPSAIPTPTIKRTNNFQG